MSRNKSSQYNELEVVVRIVERDESPLTAYLTLCEYQHQLVEISTIVHS